MTWLMSNLVGIIGIIISGFIAYHVYFLSQRIDLRDRLRHKDNIRKITESVLSKIRAGYNSKVELINVKKYIKHYPHDNDFNKHGYTYLGAELKTLQFDGIEFFCAVRELYKKSDGTLTIKKCDTALRETFNVFEVGLVPYEWIEYIDSRGDELSYRPQFFIHFKGVKKGPYKYLSYYIESDTYQKGSDPMDFRWKKIEIE